MENNEANQVKFFSYNKSATNFLLIHFNHDSFEFQKHKKNFKFYKILFSDIFICKKKKK